jgi:hypothetical protein
MTSEESKIKNQEYYLKNKDKIKQKTKLWNDNNRKQVLENNKLIKKRNYAFLWRYLKIFGKCVDCGITDDRVLEFDHIRDDKIDGVKRLADGLASLERLKTEMRKCEVRCCNCHRIKTQEQLGWRKNWVDHWRK